MEPTTTSPSLSSSLTAARASHAAGAYLTMILTFGAIAALVALAPPSPEPGPVAVAVDGALTWVAPVLLPVAAGAGLWALISEARKAHGALGAAVLGRQAGLVLAVAAGVLAGLAALYAGLSLLPAVVAATVAGMVAEAYGSAAVERLAARRWAPRRDGPWHVVGAVSGTADEVRATLEGVLATLPRPEPEGDAT